MGRKKSRSRGEKEEIMRIEEGGRRKVCEGKDRGVERVRRKRGEKSENKKRGGKSENKKRGGKSENKKERREE